MSQSWQQVPPPQPPGQGAPLPTPPVQYPERQSLQTQAIVQIVIGAMCGAMIPSILGIIALVKLDEPTTARALVKWGWISMIIIAALIVLVFLVTLVVPLVITLITVGAASTS
ncbi:hypothetical protein Bra3105_02675 [Brachybacterium halotolerans subsp. kimchii]|nr:hypothetical protein [Brachybacterium halotolerans]UEJ83248.1 hypothetical protein Bra3105_02675 [Brachybacterium halotolerans subsp. kimchii]